MKPSLCIIAACALLGCGRPEPPKEQPPKLQPEGPVPTPQPKAPIIVAPDMPADEAHGTTVPKCAKALTNLPTPTDLQQTDPPFGNAYAEILKASRMEHDAEVIRLAEQAAALAKSPEEWTLLEQARFTAYLELKDKFRALRAVDAALSLGCLSDLMAATYRQIHTDLRKQLALPPG